jgi:hypothetical protein
MLAQFFRAGYAAGNRQDFAVLRLGMDPAFEYRAAPELFGPDQDPVFYGHDAYARVWRHWLDAFGDLSLEPEELLDFGDNVLVTAQFSGRGAHSGVTVSLTVFQLFHFGSDSVVRQDDFADRTQALEAAGRE